MSVGVGEQEGVVRETHTLHESAARIARGDINKKHVTSERFYACAPPDPGLNVLPRFWMADTG